MPNTELYIGIMSGTSLDGIDAVLADLAHPVPKQLAEAHLSFEPSLRADLATLCDGLADHELERAMECGLRLARCYADAVHQTLQSAGIDAAQIRAIGCHGQTIRHRPEKGFTVQINNPALLAELTGSTVVADFRSRDIAAGGQGAPLVPAFHRAAFQSANADRVIANIGGIANLTCLPCAGETTGFDCGPGNGLMDAWVHRHLGEPYDREGAWAMGGKLVPALLDQFWRTSYFHLAPPKSTGRELFNLAWLEAHDVNAYPLQDIQRTLLELTAQGISHHVEAYCGGTTEVFVCGGGARNSALMRALQIRLPQTRVTTTDQLGVPVMNVEALAFAWLAKQTMEGRPGNLPAVTGARHPAVLGAIYPR